MSKRISWEALKGIDPNNPIDLLPGSPLDSISPVEIARRYFAKTGKIVSPTADVQQWDVPGAGASISAEQARQISLEVRQQLGSAVL